MAELLSPGVFVEEVPSQVQVVGSVSTSTMAIVGFTKKGPTDTATLVTSFDQFTRTFGLIAKESFVGLSVAAFFSNGGQRAYIVRVVPADAVAAACAIQSKTTDQVIWTADGGTTVTKTALTTNLKVNSGASPVVAGSVSIRMRIAGTAVVADLLKQRDDLTPLLLIPTQAGYEGQIKGLGLPAYDPSLDSVVPGSATVKWLIGVTNKTLALTTSNGWLDTGTTGAGSTATLDRRTGRITILFAGAEIPASGDTSNIKLDFTPTAATITLTDNGAGVIAGTGLTSGAITYATGAYSLVFAVAPYTGSPLVTSYKINAWSLTPISKGKWGNNVRVTVSGNADNFVAATNSYTAFNVNVYLLNDLGNYELVETYEELSLSDPTSAVFFPDVVNELSSYFTVAEPGGNEAPGELAGVARTQVLAGGDATTAGQVITSASASTGAVLAAGPIAPRTLSISWVDSASGLTKSVKDDGNGNLIGDLDLTYAASITAGGVTVAPNDVDYASGTFNFKVTAPIKTNTFVVASYRTLAAETKHIENFGDTTKGYTAGTDGTFNTTNFSRNQFTNSSLLSSSYKGLYALERIDDILQVVVPDFAGDVTVTGDLLDYAASRASQPSGGDRFIILTVPKGTSAQGAVDWFRFTLGRYSDFAALYWPWVKVSDPNANNRSLVMPPLGHVAGVYARTDNNKNVGKSPGGTVDGALNFLLGLEMKPTHGERDLVYPNKINPLISSDQTGTCIWGVRTISNQSDWKYINARRLFMFLEKSIYNSTFWIVFENDGSGLWSRIKTQIGGFLQNLFNDNYFAGNTPKQAYSVVVDSTNNTAASIDAGQVIIDVGAAPNKPAEFVRFRFTQQSIS